MKISFIGPSYQSRSHDVNDQICRNFYQEKDSTGKNLIALYPFPGLRHIDDLGDGPCRGDGLVFGSVAYFVINNKFKSFNGTTLQDVSTINTTGGRIYMARNDTQLMLVDSADGWIWDGATLAQITDADFPNASHVAYVDGYFLVNDLSSGRFYISALNDGATWSATDFGTAIRNPDLLVALSVIRREVWLFGTYTTEVWYNSGNADFPFAPIQGGFIEIGCAAAHSVAKVKNSLAWLAQTERGGPQVVLATGFNVQTISTAALNYEFSTYSVVDDAEAFSYSVAGHEFYEITFPTANKTWLYDIHSEQWTELSSYDAGRHRASGHVALNNFNYVGDYSNSTIYELDPDIHSEILKGPVTGSITRSGGTATFTLPSHPFISSDTVTIRGAYQTAYNKRTTIFNVTANTFDYYVTGTPTTPATGMIEALLENPQIATRTSPHLHKDQKLITWNSLQIDFESGVGITSGQGEDPQAMLRWSDDGGFTWSNIHYAAIGKIGKYRERAIWRRLGSARDRIYEVSVSDPVKKVIIDANAEITLGAH